MPERFKNIDPQSIKDNVFVLLENWVLIVAGEINSFNMMTASWGALGRLWDKNVVFCFIRPTRYTFEFMEKSSFFTICVLPLEYRKVLNLCGTKSGREVNKMKETGLTPIKSEHDSTYFAESRLVLECKKIYIHDLNPVNFLDENIKNNYPQKDYHRLYVGEILSCLVK